MVLSKRSIIKVVITYLLITSALVFVYQKGRSHAHAQCEKVNAQQRAKAYQKALLLNNDKYYLQERLYAASANVENLLNYRMREYEKTQNAIHRQLATDALQLRLPTSGCPAPNRNRASGAATSIEDHHGTAGCKLSKADAGFLISLAGEADAIVHKFTACQQRLNHCQKTEPPK